jgi:uncharacterized protein YcbK (DUF882 family)
MINYCKEYGKYIKVNSGYRVPKLNKRVGGVAKSQHQKGEALFCLDWLW